MKPKNRHITRFNIKSITTLLMTLIITLSLISFVGCGSDNSTSANENPTTNNNNNNNEEPGDPQESNEVGMASSSFNVGNLQIEAGTTVTWINSSSVNHTVTSGERGSSDAGTLFDSGTLAPGEEFSHTFEEAGAYSYFCDFHVGMDAEVTVSE